MRDNSEPLIAIQEPPSEPDKESTPAAEPRGSGSTPVTQAEPDAHALEERRSTPSHVRADGARQPTPRDSNSTHRRTSDTRELAPRRGSKQRAKRDFDPLTRIFALMERERKVGMSIGLAGALLFHGAGAAHGYSSLLDMSAFAGVVRSAVVDDVRATYAVEVNKPPPPPPPAPEPEPEKPQPQQRAPSAPQPQAEKPPAPAQAAKVLTADPDPSEPLDLTDQGFVSGEGDRFAGGVTSATGTSKTAVRDLDAKPGGVVGGKGTAAPPPPPPKEDLSRPATPASRDWGDCGFPAEADVEQIDFMRLSIVVTVGTDGRAKNVTVLKDPGYGFGNQARQCALRKSYNVGLNAEGKAVVTTTPPFIVTFRR